MTDRLTLEPEISDVMRIIAGMVREHVGAEKQDADDAADDAAILRECEDML